MSTEGQSSSTQTTTQSSEGQIDYKALLAEKERSLQETALEAKKYRQANAEYKAKLEEYERKKLETGGDYKSMYEQEKAKREQVQGSFKAVWLESQIAVEAQKLGCVDPETLLKLISVDEIEVDENFKINSDQVKFKLDSLKKSKPFLFKETEVKVINGVPNNGAPKKQELKNLTPEMAKQALLKLAGG